MKVFLFLCFRMWNNSFIDAAQTDEMLKAEFRSKAVTWPKRK